MTKKNTTSVEFSYHMFLYYDIDCENFGDGDDYFSIDKCGKSICALTDSVAKELTKNNIDVNNMSTEGITIDKAIIKTNIANKNKTYVIDSYYFEEYDAIINEKNTIRAIKKSKHYKYKKDGKQKQQLQMSSLAKSREECLLRLKELDAKIQQIKDI
ncbi:MAG: hypothetical protein WC523_04775 [Patescibacteria group bacterium]